MQIQLTNNSAARIVTPLGTLRPGQVVTRRLKSSQYSVVSAQIAAIADLATKVLEGAATASWVDAPGVTTGSATAQTFTVAGVDTHSPVAVSFRGNLPAGCLVSAQATAANTVVVTVGNLSGGTVDVPMTTLDVVWTNTAVI